MKKLLSVPFVALLTMIGFTPTSSDAQSGIEDTWKPDLGDCSGSPTDCLDTIVIRPE